MNGDALRVEEAGLNALQSQRQLFYDGWLLRLSPGKARRARSVNPHFGSSLPTPRKIEHCERIYAARGLPVLFRMTPFVQPAGLEGELVARGYVAFDETLVQVAPLERAPEARTVDDGIALTQPPVEQFVEAVGALRNSPPEQRAAHLERLVHSPLDGRHVLALEDGRPVAAGKLTLHEDLAGIFDVVTAEDARGRGIATRVIAHLLARAWERGARLAYLQVDAGNAPALAIYRRFGFTTAYTYHYCGRPGEEG